MEEPQSNKQVCVIVGASHAGVNCAFALRREGWHGKIVLFDTDPSLPYHRPPLSKSFLKHNNGLETIALRALDNYEQSGIELQLGIQVKAINRTEKKVITNDGRIQPYDKLVLAIGARPFMPKIPGIATGNNIFPMRTAEDTKNIRARFQQLGQRRIVIIGGGYIGLETAASLNQPGAHVTILERENRVLARVTAPAVSMFFQNLHRSKGVDIMTMKDVISIKTKDGAHEITCADHSTYVADMIIIGVGILVNTELAQQIGLAIDNGIRVNSSSQTSDPDIYAIGDCTSHFNPYYKRFVRLESVQNAVDQAKIAASHICGKDSTYDSIPWFWSDQYDVKLQMVGLSHGYNQCLIRQEEKKNSFSVWYFKDEQLLSVDAINNGKAYILGSKFIHKGVCINKNNLVDTSIEFKPANLIIE